MNADQYAKAIDALGLTKIEAAELLGVTIRTQERWLDGTREVAPPAWRFLNFLLATKRSGSYAIKMLKKERT